MSTTTEIQTSTIRALMRLIKPSAKYKGLGDIDRELLKYLMFDTVYSWITKNRKEQQKVLHGLMDKEALVRAHAFVIRNRVKTSTVTLRGQLFYLNVNVRTPAKRLDKDKLRSYMVQMLGLDEDIIDDVFEKCSSDAEAATSLSVESVE